MQAVPRLLLPTLVQVASLVHLGGCWPGGLQTSASANLLLASLAAAALAQQMHLDQQQLLLLVVAVSFCPLV
jgi:hypothetical protein